MGRDVVRTNRSNAELVAELPRTRDELVVNNEPLVWTVAQRLRRPPGMELEDLVQEGVIALCTCADYFDPTRGVAFSTYVYVSVRCRMLRYLNANWSMIRVPVSTESSRIKYAEDRQRARQVAPIDEASEALCPAEETHDVEIRGTDARIDANETLAVARTLGLLTPRAEYILRRRAEDRTLKWIGTRLGIGHERVRQLEQRALGRLHATFGDERGPEAAAIGAERGGTRRMKARAHE